MRHDWPELALCFGPKAVGRPMGLPTPVRSVSLSGSSMMSRAAGYRQLFTASQTHRHDSEENDV